MQELVKAKQNLLKLELKKTYYSQCWNEEFEPDTLDNSLRSKRFRGVQGQSPCFLFWLSPQFRAGKIPFLGLSLLPNPMETLAAQAS